MKIALVCGHFMPEAGYYEVHLAEAFVKSGHQVRIFTSDRSNLKLKKEKKYTTGLYTNSKDKYEIERFRPWFRIGSTILTTGLLAEVRKFKPEIVVAIGIAKLFPVPVLINKNKRDFKLYTFFGENSEYYQWNTLRARIRSGLKLITRNTLKKPFYQLSIKNSDKVFQYTPETLPFLIRLVNKTNKKLLESKSVNTSLGFDRSCFYFNDIERNQIREEYGLGSQEFLILTVTRYSKSKSLEFMVDSIVKLKSEGYPVKYWIIGFNSHETLDFFRKYIKSKGASEYISCFSFMNYSDLRKHQAAADIGFWCQVTISIQQSMGTGLPVILEDKKSVSHLIRSGSNGLYFTKCQINETLKEAFISFRKEIPSDYEKMRKKIEQLNADEFSYEKLVHQIITL